MKSSCVLSFLCYNNAEPVNFVSFTIKCWSHCSDISPSLASPPAACCTPSLEFRAVESSMALVCRQPVYPCLADKASPYLLSLKTLKIIAGDLCAKGALIPEPSLSTRTFFSSVTSEHYIFIPIWSAWHLHSRLGSGWAFFFNAYGFRYLVRSLFGSH